MRAVTVPFREEVTALHRLGSAKIIGGPRETWPWWICEPTLQSERARMETLLLRFVRARSIPITSHPRRVAQARFRIAERTVSRWIQPASKNPDPARRWLAFLRNHRDAI